MITLIQTVQRTNQSFWPDIQTEPITIDAKTVIILE